LNNKIKQEKFRKLSLTVMITGILAFGGAYFLMVFVMPFIGAYLKNFIPEEFLIIFIVSCYLICLPIPAIVCGSIDLKKIKAGKHSNKGRGMDISGIVLGSVFILLVVWFILGEILVSH